MSSIMRMDHLQKNVLLYILNFLRPEEILQMRKCGRNLQLFIDTNLNIYLRYCLQQFFTFDFDYYCDYGDQLEYKQEKKIKDRLIEGQTTQNWREFLLEYQIIQKHWGEVLEQLNFKDFSKQFIFRLFNTLKTPSLPLLVLRRENIGNHCNSLLQSKLAIMLWEGNSQGNDKIIDEDNKIQFVMSHILNNKQKYIQEVHDYGNKNEFLEMRWYNYSEKEKGGRYSNVGIQINNTTNWIQNQVTITKCESKEHLNQECGEQSQIQFNELSSQQQQQSSQILDKTQEEMEDEEEFKELDDIIPLQFVKSKSFINKAQCFNNDCESSNTSVSTNNSVSNQLFCLNQNLQKKKIPAIIQIMNLLYDTFIFQTKIVRAYLYEHSDTENPNSHKNGFDLLSEYSILWQIYVASLYELEDDFADFFKVFNEAYESLFPNYPSFPKMTPWRMMTKLWISEVFQKDQLDEKLYGCFTKIINRRRTEIFKFQIKQTELDEKQTSDYYIPQQMDITHDLLYNFTKVKKFSVQDFGCQFDYCHKFFKENNGFVDTLLQSFVQCVIDLSLNEINVHYLGHTDLQTEIHYKNLENYFLQSSEQYFQSQESIFKEDTFIQYREVLDGDAKFLSKILSERTMQQHKNMMLNKWMNLFTQLIRQYIIDNKFHEDNIDIEKEKEDQEDKVSQIIYNQLKDICQIKSENNLESQEDEECKLEMLPQLSLQQSKSKMFNELPQLDEFDDNDCLCTENQNTEIDCKCEKENYFCNQNINLTINNNQENQNIFSNYNNLFNQNVNCLNIDINQQDNQLASNISFNLNTINTNNINSMNIQAERKCSQNEQKGNKQLQSLKRKSRIIARLMRKDEKEISKIVIQYNKVQKQIEDLQQKCDQDFTIEELCQERQLPKILSDTESKFYNINNQINVQELEEIVNSFNQNKQDQNSVDEINSDTESKGLKDNLELEEYNSGDEEDINAENDQDDDDNNNKHDVSSKISSHKNQEYIDNDVGDNNADIAYNDQDTNDLDQQLN